MSPATDSELRDTRQNPAYVFKVSEAGLPCAPASRYIHIPVTYGARAVMMPSTVSAPCIALLPPPPRISSNASPSFFLCGELLNERQKVSRQR
jgi:hypothetical protein